MPASLNTLCHWVNTQLLTEAAVLTPITRGLSARHYYRLVHDNQPFILADCSDDTSELLAFIHLDSVLQSVGVRVPRIYHVDITQGFLLLEDFGAHDLFSILKPDNMQQEYKKAGRVISMLQTKLVEEANILPCFDSAFYEREWGIFLQGYLKNYHHANIEQHENLLKKTLEQLIENNHAQTQVFVHRDFHSQNLMVLNNGDLGVLDFQSARKGPLSYDVVSLLKDCYMDWPCKTIDALALELLQPLWKENLSDETMLKFFDLTGLQRHLKVMGQFAKQVNNGNEARKKDLIRVENYVLHVCARYNSLHDFNDFLRKLIIR